MEKLFPIRWSLVPLLIAVLVACPTPPVGDAPATPTNFIVSSTTATSISLSWTLVSGATSYVLERGVASGTKTQIATPSGSTNTYTDTGLTAGTSYGYALKAVNAKGSSQAALVAGIPSAGGADSDNDGVSNADENAGWDVVISRAGTQLSSRKVTSDPTKADTDGDGLNDSQERTRFIDPRSDDTDADSLKDADEVNTWVSNPADVDTDKDSQGNPNLYDGNELSIYGTSPTVADTDGDFYSDYREAIDLGNTFNPVIANVPRFELSLASAPSISLKITRTSDNSTVSSKTSSLALGTSNSKSSTDTNTQRFNAEVSATVGVAVEAGLTGGVTASASVTATAGYGTESTKSFTSDSSVNTQKTAEEARTEGSTSGQQVSGATMSVGFRVANTGGLTFKLSNLSISVLRRNPEDPSKFLLVGAMTPNLGSAVPPSITLQTGETSGILEATLDFTDDNEAVELMRNPADLKFEFAGYDLLDGNTPPNSFKFQNDTTNGQTAQFVIDYGNGNVVRQRVATNVERVGGQIVGVKLGKVLNDILKLPYTTADSNGLKVITGVKDAVLGATVSSKTQADPKSVWVVVTSNGLSINGLNADDILIKSGSEVRLILARDADGDKLLESEEFFYETSDTVKDSDGDGLDDFAEVRTGWIVTVSSISKKVFSNPKVVDSDGDTLNDAQEKTKLSNPLSADTDRDGTLDAADPEPSNPAVGANIIPVISNFNVSVTGKTATVTANVSDNNLANVVINWGDNTANTTLTGAAATTVSTQHTYATSSNYTVTITATDLGNLSATQNKPANVLDITSNLLAWYKLDGAIVTTGSGVLDSSGNNKHGSVSAQQGACVKSDPNAAGLINKSYRFNTGQDVSSCGSSTVGQVQSPNIAFSQSFTLSAWIKPVGGNDAWILGQTNLNASSPWARLVIGTTQDDDNNNNTIGSGGKVSFILPKTGATIIVTDPVAVGTNWVHYTAVVSNIAGVTDVKLYRDGVAVPTLATHQKTNTYTNPSASQPFILATNAPNTNNGGSYFQGNINEVRIYGRALAPNEVIALKDAPEN
jgi:hypothetical protein